MSLPDYQLMTSDGEAYALSDYDDYVLLIVNTATGCGLASQFNGLESLYQQYKDQNFVVLGFPTDQFHQEKTSDDDMITVCQTNFGTSFPLHQKIKVNGDEAHPLFQWLKTETSGLLTTDIKWNFTKFLIDRQGHIVKRYAPTTSPEQIQTQIEALL